MEKISVIMPVFNQNKAYLNKSIESILNQTYSNLEFVIIDDGSNETTKRILKYYYQKDTRIKIITNTKRLDISKSLNKAIRKSSGKYIARMDSDDISMLDRLDFQLKYLKKNNYDFIGGNCLIISADGKEIEKKEVTLENKIKSQIIKGNIFIHSTFFGKKEVFENLYNENISRAQDYEFLLRIISKGYRIGSLGKFILKYRIHSKGMTRKNFKQEWYALKARILAIFKYHYGYRYLPYIVRSFIILLIPYKMKLFLLNLLKTKK